MNITEQQIEGQELETYVSAGKVGATLELLPVKHLCQYVSITHKLSINRC